MTRMDDTDEDGRDYCVVVNAEEQYSLWPADRPPPPGWRQTGPTGSRESCLEHVRTVWTDMRPLSLRRAMADGAR